MPYRRFHQLGHPAARRFLLYAAVLLYAIVAYLALCPDPVGASVTDVEDGAIFPVVVPDFSVPVGRMRPPLPYRIISFHRGRADRNLIKLAAQLGFNAVQFQIEGSNELGVKDFAQRDAREHLVDYCHNLGMQVTVWVHEFSDLPPAWSGDYLGPVTATNEKLWQFLDARYERILGTTLANVDGVALTVVETQVRATDTQVMLRLANLLAEKCHKHHKTLMIRTFVWTPEEFATVMAAVNQLPADAVIMSKIVPQDWQMRGAMAPEIGAVGGRAQIAEYDACGEYFLKSDVANCMVDLLKTQFDYCTAKGVQGICVRADRDDDSVLFGPNEVNLWALGLMAAGVTDKADDIWAMWGKYRYGAAAAGVIRALEPTAAVVTEITSLGSFTFGDTRRKEPPLPDDGNMLLMNWQNWRWNAAYLGEYYMAARGDGTLLQQVAGQKEAAGKLAEKSLRELEAVRGQLSTVEYMILHTKLMGNKAYLESRAPMMLAALEYRALKNAPTPEKERAMAATLAGNIARVREVAKGLEGTMMETEYLGRKWQVGAVEGMTRADLEEWAEEAEAAMAENEE